MKTLKNKYIKIGVVCLGVVLVLFIAGFVYYNQSLKAVSSDEEKVVISIEEGMTSDQIIQQLEDNDLIRNKTVTKLYVRFHGLTNFKAGNFILYTSWDTPKIIETLNDANMANADETIITFREGMWAKDVAALIEENTEVKAKDLLALWNDEKYLSSLIKKYDFLSEDILNDEYKVKLEGYLYPETYSFKKEATAEEITETFLNQFQKIIEPYMDDINKSDMSLHEIITFASIVQYEASKKEDMEMISQVFYNRLEKGMKLESSVTVCYALYDDMNSGEDCEINTDIDSPYNTYQNEGLPIGPILNPGEDAINSVLNPKKNDYLYFVADIYGDGTVYYSKTLQEQEANIDKFNLRK